MHDETRRPQGTGVMDEQEIRERGGRQGLSTADIAGSARPGEREAEPRPGQRRDVPAEAGREEHAPLLPEEEARSLHGRWEAIQASFVDAPHQAVEQADGLVAELMQRLAEGFAAERADLESQWSRGQDVDTEELRQALRRYRSFFGRLLSV